MNKDADISTAVYHVMEQVQWIKDHTPLKRDVGVNTSEIVNLAASAAKTYRVPITEVLPRVLAKLEDLKHSPAKSPTEVIEEMQALYPPTTAHTILFALAIIRGHQDLAMTVLRLLRSVEEAPLAPGTTDKIAELFLAISKTARTIPIPPTADNSGDSDGT